MQIGLSPELVTFLTELKASVDGLRAELAADRAAAHSPPLAPAEPRDSYSVDEAATLLGKNPYTVREWCRNGQVNATKSAERRGAASLWRISAKEIARYRNEGRV